MQPDFLMNNKIKGRGIVFLLLLTTAQIWAQQLEFGFNTQYGVLCPKINLEKTGVSQYAASQNRSIEDVKSSFHKMVFSPSFGLSVEGYYTQLPVYARLDLGTSKSAIQYLSTSLEIGLGQDINLIDGYNFVTAKIGYKFAYDHGFGRPTILNSVKTFNEAQAVAEFLDKKEFRKAGKLIPIKLGYGHDFDGFKVGAEIQMEIDVTSVISTARMNSLSIGIYVKRCKSFKSIRYANDL